jgi:outer membrane protein OmpA-like peptidoglycan-associated protein
VKFWYAGKRPVDPVVEPAGHSNLENEPLPARKEDRLLALQGRTGAHTPQEKHPSSGDPLEEHERTRLEAAFGEDLSEVRIHRDEAAGELATEADASAFTTGRDIYFAPGAYGPGTLAHEVTHVLQQGQAASVMPGEDAHLEHQANTASSAVMSGHTAHLPGVAAAPAMQRQPAPGTQPSAVKLMPTDSITLDNFDIDKFEISGNNKQKLDAFAKRLQSTLSSAPDSIVTIAGYADAPGTEPHNLALGQQRADAIRDYLVAKGMPADKLHTVSMGEGLPVVPSKGYESRNRRVEISVIERSLFKPPAPSVTPGPAATPAPAPATTKLPKPLDLKYHPHDPTPGEELQERMRQVDRAVREAQAAEKANPGTSVADATGHVLRNAAKKLGLPRWVQDQAESLGKDLPAKGADAVIDQIDKSMDSNTQNALKALINAAMQMKVK